MFWIKAILNQGLLEQFLETFEEFLEFAKSWFGTEMQTDSDQFCLQSELTKNYSDDSTNPLCVKQDRVGSA